ncbi:MAG: DUF4153 domain-containing protein [Phenylobacterium sp.]|uniref:DUF4153 domain-containing protein n=1 Tax=Phenylobacterium sp. TaxID=1871053 RepID=UPI00391B9882
MSDLAERSLMMRAGRARLAIGLVQGLALFVLFDRLKPGDGEVLSSWLAAARAAAVLTPFVLLGGLGAMRIRALAAWGAAAAVGVAAIGGYAAATGHDALRNSTPWPLYGGATAVTLFIIHHLVVAADQEGRWRASYRRYFDLGWTDAVRLALSAAFVAALWILLMLAKSLFDMIGLEVVGRAIRNAWFAYPATAVAFAMAVHLTDIRASLVRGVRTVALALLSWLLPLMALIVGGFLAALPFTGLEPLWNTRSAAGVLLAAAAALIILINAAYQDGPREDLPALLKWAGRIGAALIAPLVGVAAYALGLRVSQYGLTPERIFGGACVLVGAVFAVGYFAAAFSKGAWLKRVEASNVVTAHMAAVILLALMSPLADPRRLSVEDQVRRLNTGRVTPQEFDYAFLKFRAGRWGEAALKDLAARREGPNAAVIAAHAAQALKQENPYDPLPPTGAERAAAVAVAGGRALPPSFAAQTWPARDDPLRFCAGRPARDRPTCAALLADVDGDGREDIILFGGGERSAFAERDGRWTRLGRLEGQICGDEVESVVQGKARVVPPVDRWLDVEVAGRRLKVAPQPACPGVDRDVADVAIIKPRASPGAD